MWPNLQLPADLVTLTEEILNGKIHFLRSELQYQDVIWRHYVHWLLVEYSLRSFLGISIRKASSSNCLGCQCLIVKNPLCIGEMRTVGCVMVIIRHGYISTILRGQEAHVMPRAIFIVWEIGIDFKSPLHIVQLTISYR